MLNGFLTGLTTILKAVVTGAAAGTLVVDYSCDSLFTSWNTLTNSTTLASDTSALSTTMNRYLRQGFPPLTASITLTPANGNITSATLSLTDTITQYGLVSRVLNTDVDGQSQKTSVTFTTGALTQTFNFKFMAAMEYIKVYCSEVRGFVESHYVLPGLKSVSLLGIIPASGFPGDQEIYVTAGSHERLTIPDMQTDSLTFTFTDEQDMLIPIPYYTMVVSLDYVDKTEEQRYPTMFGGRVQSGK